MSGWTGCTCSPDDSGHHEQDCGIHAASAPDLAELIRVLIAGRTYGNVSVAALLTALELAEHPEIPGRVGMSPTEATAYLDGVIEQVRAGTAGRPLCACGKPAEHVNADPDGDEWACRVTA